MSSTPVYVLPYYMEVKPGHPLRQTYSGFRDDNEVPVDIFCATFRGTGGDSISPHYAFEMVLARSSLWADSITSMTIPRKRGDIERSGLSVLKLT